MPNLSQNILQENQKTLSANIDKPDPPSMIQSIDAYRNKLEQWDVSIGQ